MITLTNFKSRMLQVLEDPEGKRFDNAALEEAIRQAISLLDQRLPNIAVCTFTVTVGGRDQSITGLGECLYLVTVCINPESSSSRELEPESGFSYRLQNSEPLLHFSGRRTPHTGDVIKVTYACPHSLSGLDTAAVTTIPASCESALVNGAAGQACLLRASLLTEAYGTRPVECSRLLEISHLLMDRFEQSLAQFKTIQEFGFPPGFALDADDKQTGRC
jgi:hypothetical protein